MSLATYAAERAMVFDLVAQVQEKLFAVPGLAGKWLSLLLLTVPRLLSFGSRHETSSELCVLKDDVDQAITALEDFLGVLRQHEPESVPADVACTELVATFHSVVDQAANHDSSKPCSRKSMA
ncbi:hypothetical protein AK812_SmicGene44772 [Symbiodinium microadriaticum]|uniref:Uncharacterized protein n=1 Tax=Symbiodinium microadriaticum TaxID=2951 RepID=A0A1Q9BXL8_SYMMI|nr:hypothetical protein AK812_SmicGene44772 [Symbiodinium microadriaticum]